MIQVKPQPENEWLCPQCSHLALVREIVIQPIVALTDCICKHCGFEFFQALSVGHTTVDVFTIDKSEKTLYPPDTKKTWLTEAILKACRGEKPGEIKIRKIVHKKYDRVIVLNTLDFLYGHVLLKLYNSIHHLDYDTTLGLVVIIPQSFEWLIPSGCAEVWIVDLNLNELAYFHTHIQKFATQEFTRFHTIYLSKSYSHPDFTPIDISRFTGIKPFELREFSQQQPTITFILREDRWWFTSSLDYWFYRVCRKLRVLKTGSRALSWRQNRLVKKTISLIRQKFFHANFFIIGLGTTGTFKAYVHDRRRNDINDAVEQAWCRIYAQSHVVIGVHGSNMLLPTAHAAGCVDILPEDRYGNMVQDLSVRYSDRKQLFLYRFADQYSRPNNIANKTLSIIENFQAFDNSMCCNVYRPPGFPGAPASRRDDIYAIS